MRFRIGALCQRPFLVNIDPSALVQVHVQVRDPHQGSKAEQVTAPVIEHEAKLEEQKENERTPVREAVLAGEQVKELALGKPAACLALEGAVIGEFAKHLLMSDGPGRPGDGNGQQKELDDLI